MNGRPQTHTDIAPGSIPISWDLSPAFEIADFQQGYSLLLYDLDPVGADDLIGSTVTFRVNSFLAGRPTYFLASDLSGTLMLRLTLRWQ